MVELVEPSTEKADIRGRLFQRTTLGISTHSVRLVDAIFVAKLDIQLPDAHLPPSTAHLTPSIYVPFSLRSPQAEKAAKREGISMDNASIMHVDLSSLESVRQFVTNFKATGMSLDVLVANAALYLPLLKEPEYTADGFELSVATNHLVSPKLCHFESRIPNTLVVACCPHQGMPGCDLST